MIRLGICSLVLGASAFLAAPAPAEAQAQGPDFKEVYDTIRTHLEGVSEPELNRAAVQGLVGILKPKVSLVEKGSENAATDTNANVSKASLFEGQIAYVRIGRVGDGLGQAVSDACRKVAGTNKLNGVVLDLRYTEGDDYAAAAGTVDLFLKKERPLLDWGNGVTQSKPKEDAISVPVTALVNHQTIGAPEALAAALRETGAGLILGSQTAGLAMVAHDYPLSDGSKLRIAAAPIRLGDGSALSAKGVKPDIAVEVSPQDERAYYSDAFKELSRTNFLAADNVGLTNQAAGANRTRRPRFNEAELVRERREGLPTDAELSGAAEVELDKPTVRDPVLARALDVLKGLAVVRQSRS